MTTKQNRLMTRVGSERGVLFAISIVLQNILRVAEVQQFLTRVLQNS